MNDVVGKITCSKLEVCKKDNMHAEVSYFTDVIPLSTRCYPSVALCVFPLSN